MEKRVTCYEMNDLFMRSSLAGHLLVSALTSGGNHVAAWCEPTLHIFGIGMASTLQRGVNRHCLTKAYLWHVCKGLVRRRATSESRM